MTKIVFFGNEQLAQGVAEPITPIFDKLINFEYEISAVVLPKQSKIISRKLHEIKIVESAKANDIRIIYADEIDLEKELLKIDAKIGVLSSYGQIVSQKIIDVFEFGIVNIHPSLLPKYRGSTPIESTILNGDKIAGVSLMSLTNEMDAGPIYKQEAIKLRGDEDKNELYSRLSNLGSDLLLEALPNIISGKLKPSPQQNVDINVSYTQKLSKTDGELDPTTMTATECERKVRAYLGFPKTRLDFMGEKVIITKAKSLENFDGDDWPDIVKCANNSALQIIKLVSPKSGKNMKITDYLNGLK